jgi:hypothetical protein
MDRDTVTALDGVSAALERMAAAMAEARLDGMLESDTALEGAVRAWPPEGRIHTGTVGPHEAGVAMDRCRAALTRCRRLGASLSDVVRLALEAQGHSAGYGPHAGTQAPAGRALDARG